MPAKQAEPGPNGPTDAQIFWVLYALLAGHCCCIWPLTRKNFGRDALWPAGPAAMVLMFFYAGLAECPEMLVYLALWFAAVLYHRVRTLARDRHSRAHTHSRVDGELWVARRLWPFGVPSDNLARGVIEPLVAVVGGGLVYVAISPPLGTFLMWAAASLIFKHVMEEGARAARLRAWRDKDWEMREMADRLRSGR